MEKRKKIITKNMDLYYSKNHALKNINMDILENEVVSLIGPSGCGKSTYLKSINRMNDLVEGVKITGEILIDNENIYDEDID
ncbi:ATP-binding cassette domain-containing protein, partial [Anaerofustis stercorihominis]